MEKLENGIYGILWGGVLKRYEEITDSEIKKVSEVAVKSDLISVMIREEKSSYDLQYSEKKANSLFGWRLPTRHEMIDIMDVRETLSEFFGKLGNDTFINSAGNFWTCEPYYKDSMWAYNYKECLQPWHKKLGGYYLFVKPFEWRAESENRESND